MRPDQEDCDSQRDENDAQRHHDELLLAILVAGLSANTVYTHEDDRDVVQQALYYLAEIRRQLEGEG